MVHELWREPVSWVLELMAVRDEAALVRDEKEGYGI